MEQEKDTPRELRMKRLKEMGYVEVKKRKIVYTPKQLKYLKRLNSLLLKKEKELYQRCKLLYDLHEKRLIKKGGDLDDYELEVVVTYFTGLQETRYVHTEYISYSTFNDTNFGFCFGHPEKETEWGDWLPNLGTKLCWFAWKFFDDIPIKLRYKITEIWFEVHIREQHFADIVKYKYI